MSDMSGKIATLPTLIKALKELRDEGLDLNPSRNVNRCVTLLTGMTSRLDELEAIQLSGKAARESCDAITAFFNSMDGGSGKTAAAASIVEAAAADSSGGSPLTFRRSTYASRMRAMRAKNNTVISFDSSGEKRFGSGSSGRGRLVLAVALPEPIGVPPLEEDHVYPRNPSKKHNLSQREADRIFRK